ncbi:MAG TPA: hypothetical protein VJ508_03940, partial [Saprospiraceae bacterium]|nr:hypothetical protein [Saprospiraceae bacterium]
LAKWSKRETELNEYWDAFADSMTMWSKDLFPDSLFKNFQFDSKQFFVPKPRNDDWKLPPYPYPRYFNDPKFPGVPIPDMRTLPDPGNNEPLPRVIPKRRDGNEVPGFPGWRIQKLKNLT